MNETDYPPQRLNMIVAPDAEVLRADAALGKNRGCLRQKPSPAHSAAAQVDKMPVVSASIATRVFAHG